MKILHVSHASRFYEDFIDLNSHFDGLHEHSYFLFGGSAKESVINNSNVHIVNKSAKSYLCGYAALLKRLFTADKVMLHGLFDNRLLMLLSAMPWLLKKCTWFLWGGDLYVYKERKQNAFNEFFRKRVIKKLGNIATYVKGDYQLAQQWYQTEAEYMPCLLYPSNIIVGDPNVHSISKPADSEKKVLVVGNSADPQNNHLELLQVLREWKGAIGKLYLPLSYGDNKYAGQVIEQYKKEFGEDVITPILDYLPLQEYLAMIAEADIAVYGHRRQQAMGNTLQLLSKGKTVYLRGDVTQWAYFDSVGITVKDINKVDENNLMLSADQASMNIEKLHQIHHKDVYLQQLQTIYSE
ncbi:TDP-N-acetylfucosamine:lipid II N-acetylfucosaminyltransferase [Pseudoalteromonas luteoviolacea]|uniref:4-alpha-L-fucosyltransferase (Fuc4NAc transferase) n=1 Tax=Pseudoalteromonas luteoviolacea (strain 2ta16) TaxID=1353533 RepID=V4I4F2_PSEL2|nr:TDP-N-acetylfucosamine:lipid II N-acetylfucosaminyltransferase [Pseudoalteromonas luteoviolacea]ESP95124.1 4-alpha-L-fucosyltransferase (Fuc4NAc transferase) [Pseudoalteromonas luteoviolacea 2ta16]KZN42298.1 hypothetical protein N483_12305 [Pseudoalteromonas luteoviolacea NCIMB 1944]